LVLAQDNFRSGAWPGFGCWERGKTILLLAALLRLASTTVAGKLFYTGPVINVEMLVVMLEKHGIHATQQIAEGESDDAEDLNRIAKVFLEEQDYPRAHQLFYVGREDEL